MRSPAASTRISVPARSLRSLLLPDVTAAGPPGQAPAAGPAPAATPGPPGIRRAGPADAADISAVLARVHEAARACGPSDFDLSMSARMLDDPDVFCYLAPDGMLCYGWQDGNNEIIIYCLLASSAPTARALWSVIASHDSVAGTVRAYCGPADPVSWLTREPDVSFTREHAWMLRITDAAAAIAGRGYPAAAQADVVLQLADRLLPANAGRWRLSVRDGKGALSGLDPDDQGGGLPPARSPSAPAASRPCTPGPRWPRCA